VPSFLHEFLVELFRQRPELGPELLHACVGLRIEGAKAERGSIDLSQVAPTEYRSDALTVVRDAAGKAVAAVIVEVQLGEDEDKRWTWPLYLTAARASERCPAMLLVLAPDRRVARWASQAIEVGQPGFALRPIVLDYAQVPRISDPQAACASPELAVLSAMAHRDLETAAAAGAVIPVLPEDLQKLYWDVILSVLPGQVRWALEARMIKGYEYQSDFARKYVAEGRAEGRQEGLEEGMRRGIVEGVCARLPGLRDELTRWLRDQPEGRLVQLAAELGKAQDEAAVRAIFGQRS
jgi:hypothetical protein